MKRNPKKYGRAVRRLVKRQILLDKDAGVPISRDEIVKAARVVASSKELDSILRSQIADDYIRTLKARDFASYFEAAERGFLDSQHKKLIMAKKLAFRREFRKRAGDLKRMIPFALRKAEGMKRAKSKLKELGGQIRQIQRFDSIARVESKLGKGNAFEGSEAMVLPAMENPWTDSPHSEFLELKEVARKFTATVGEKFYNCRVFFKNGSFSNDRQWGISFWGRIKKTGGDPLLAIQIFDPDPKTLLSFAKAMAKRRPNDPIPIIDIYGGVFYP